MNPEKLLLTVLAAYASFDTYSDIGTGFPDLGQLPLEKPFKFQTFFKRPNKFRFRWTSRHPSLAETECPKEYALWTNGTEFKSRFFEEIEEEQNLAMLIAGAGGISNGSVVQILNVLMPNTLGLKSGWQNAADVRCLPDETVNGVDCFHVSGTVKTVDDTEVWIQKNSLLIRRLKEKIVTTEEDCEIFNAEMQSEEYWNKTLDLDVRLSAEQLATLKECKIQPSISFSIYDYASVSVNEPIDAARFEKL